MEWLVYALLLACIFICMTVMYGHLTLVRRTNILAAKHVEVWDNITQLFANDQTLKEAIVALNNKGRP